MFSIASRIPATTIPIATQRPALAQPHQPCQLRLIPDAHTPRERTKTYPGIIISQSRKVSRWACSSPSAPPRCDDPLRSTLGTGDLQRDDPVRCLACPSWRSTRPSGTEHPQRSQRDRGNADAQEEGNYGENEPSTARIQSTRSVLYPVSIAGRSEPKDVSPAEGHAPAPAGSGDSATSAVSSATHPVIA